MSTSVQTKQDSITTQVLSRVKSLQQAGGILLPPDYSVENALKGAELILQDLTTRDGKPVLEVCTRPSVANALLQMVTEGLTVLKKQGAFIAYGNKLTWQREYFGTVALAKRFSRVQKIRANVVYEGDVMKYEVDPSTGIKRLVKHEQEPENIDLNKIKGAYAILIEEDGTPVFEYMTITQIRKAWMQGAAKGNNTAHQNFTDEMCKKTVINRICKPYINESDDSALYNSTNETVEYTEVHDEEPPFIAAIQEPEKKQDTNPESIEKKKEAFTGEMPF